EAGRRQAGGGSLGPRRGRTRRPGAGQGVARGRPRGRGRRAAATVSPYFFDVATFAIAAAIGLVAYRPFIALLRGRRAGQVIQAELPREHQAKAGTPTGGGILFVGLAILGGLLATLAGHLGAWPSVAGLALGGV